MKAIVESVVARLVGMGCLFVLLVVSGDVYGLAVRGELAKMVSICSVCAVVVSLSLGRGAFVIAGKAESAAGFVANNIRQYGVLLLMMWVFASALIVAFWIAGVGPFQEWRLLHVLLSILFLGSLLWQTTCEFFFSIFNANRLQNVSFAVYCVVLMVVLLASVYIFNASSVAYVTMYICGGAIYSLWEYLMLHRLIRISGLCNGQSNGVGVWRLLTSGLPFHLDTLAGLGFSQAGPLVCACLLSNVEIGKFEMASRIASLVMLLPTVARGFVATYFARGSSSDAILRASRLAMRVTLTLIVACALIHILARCVLFPLYPQLASVFPVLNVLLLASVFNSYCVLVGPVYVALGWYFRLTVGTMIIGVVSIVLCFLFAKSGGAIGVAYSIACAYGMAAVANFFMMRISCSSLQKVAA